MERLQSQTGGAPGMIAINANRNLPRYTTLHAPTWPDADDEFAGPLAGFATALDNLAALAQSEKYFDYLLTVPCDSPLFPLDLLERLSAGLQTGAADIAVALAPELQADGTIALRSQPVFALLKCSLRESLQNYLGSGERKIDRWFHQHKLSQVAFNLPNDDPNAFANANTLDELSNLERQ